jgi:hypothetical protein
VDERELDRKLKAARDEADRFFSNWEGDGFRKKVHRRIAGATDGGRWQVRNRIKRLVPLLCAVAVCIIIVLWLPGLRGGPFPNIQENGGSVPLGNKASVPLNMAKQYDASAGGQSAHLPDFLPIDRPMDKDYDLLVVIWKDSNKDDYEVVYNFIPYQINGAGQLALPTKRVEVQVGHYLVLVGNDGGNQVNVSFKGNTIKQLGQNEIYGQYRTAAQFYAYSPGSEYIIITPRYDTKQVEKVLIEVNDKDSH